MAVPLYANFYNTSLNELRPTFFNIYDLPFLHSPNIGKIRVKVGPKTDYFYYILTSCTNRITGARTGAHQVFTTQKLCPSKIPLTMKIATTNSLFKCIF